MQTNHSQTLQGCKASVTLCFKNDLWLKNDARLPRARANQSKAIWKSQWIEWRTKSNPKKGFSSDPRIPLVPWGSATMLNGRASFDLDRACVSSLRISHAPPWNLVHFSICAFKRANGETWQTVIPDSKSWQNTRQNGRIPNWLNRIVKKINVKDSSFWRF